MKVVLILALGTLALAEAGIVSPLVYPNLAPNYIFPHELRKVISYGTKPIYAGYSVQFIKPDIYGGLLYTVPVAHQQIPASQLLLIPTVRTHPSTFIANAKATSRAGDAGSSIVTQADEATPFSVVANAGTGAAYSSAILHPNENGASVTAGAHASITGR